MQLTIIARFPASTPMLAHLLARRTVSAVKDICEERDGEGNCHCDRVEHPRIVVERDPCYAPMQQPGDQAQATAEG
jgi:hypothetical protein